MINGGIRATSIANAYGQDLAIQQGAPLLGNNFENTKNALSGGPSVSIGFGTHKSETTWTESYISQFNMGSGSMTIKSGRDINLVGTQIQAEGITLDAGQKLNILADADYYKNRSSGAGVSVSYGASGWGFGVSGNKSKTDSTTYTNAGLNAGNGTLLLKSGAEMNIIGANLDGKFIDVDAKGLLTVASVQNTSHSKNSSFGVNVNQSNAASMNGSRGNSDRTFTDNLTTILGTEGVRIHSDTGTVVEGALIANATRNQDGTLTDHGNLTVETPFLSWKDLEDIDVSKQIGGGINVSGDDGRSTSGTKTFSEIWDDTANGDYRKDETIGVTKATIGNGAINITNPGQQTQDLATLNRDINNVQIITKESETHVSITVPVPDSIANPIGNAGGATADTIVENAPNINHLLLDIIPTEGNNGGIWTLADAMVNGNREYIIKRDGVFETYTLDEIRNDPELIAGLTQVSWNGINNTPEEAIKNAESQLGATDGYIIAYSPTNGLVPDVINAAWLKLAGNGLPTANVVTDRDFRDILLGANSAATSFNFAGHSNGGTQLYLWLQSADSGLFNGSQVQFSGTPIYNNNLNQVGSNVTGNKPNIQINPGDFVGFGLGMNAKSPTEIIRSAMSIPLLFTPLSPHSNYGCMMCANTPTATPSIIHPNR